MTVLETFVRTRRKLLREFAKLLSNPSRAGLTTAKALQASRRSRRDERRLKRHEIRTIEALIITEADRLFP